MLKEQKYLFKLSVYKN